MADALSIVVPVFNEGANFPMLWSAVTAAIHSPFHMIVVYDFDEDNTVPAVQKIIYAGEWRIRLVKNSVGRGVVGAIKTGFAEVNSGPVLVMMADLSDDLAKVDPMLQLYAQGAQLVCASRYMKGGAIVNGPFLKQLFSRMAGVSLHWLRRIPTHDATNAFKLYDAQMLHSFTLESKAGFELSLEITVKAFLAGYRIAEIPSIWQERTQGKSKFKMWA